MCTKKDSPDLNYFTVILERIGHLQTVNNQLLNIEISNDGIILCFQFIKWTIIINTKSRKIIWKWTITINTKRVETIDMKDNINDKNQKMLKLTIITQEDDRQISLSIYLHRGSD